MNYKLNCNRLISCRKKLGITKSEAAKRLRLSQPAYLRYESGERTPSIQTIDEIARVFGTSTDFLIGKTSNPDRDKITIDYSTDPDLFNMVDTYYHNDESFRKRMLAYLQKFR